MTHIFSFLIRMAFSLCSLLLTLDSANADDCIEELHADGLSGTVCLRAAWPESEVESVLDAVFIDSDGQSFVVGNYVIAPGSSTPELVELEQGVYGLVVRHFNEIGPEAENGFSIDVFQLRPSGLILSSDSYQWPELEDLDADGSLEIVVFNNPSIYPADSPPEVYDWPLLFTITQKHGLRREALIDYPSYARRIQEMTQAQLDKRRAGCEEREPGRCSFQWRIDLLEQKLKTLKAYQ